MLWDYVKHFTADENWGSPSSMNGLLVLLFDIIRSRFGDCRFVIHCGYGAADHADKSEHPRGNAVDFHINSALSLIDQAGRLEMILKDLQVYDRVGLGIYPDWNNPGFHLDVRGVFARWGRIGPNYVTWDVALKHAAEKAAA
jgi:hypothetical protein